MPTLKWLSDELLDSAVSQLFTRVSIAQERAVENMERNVIDPFASLVTASMSGAETKDELRSLQIQASVAQGVASAVGGFHQQVLGSIDGFHDHDAGYDLESTAMRIVAEVKNKHNTMNSSNREAVIRDLDTAVRQKGNGWTGYLVVIVPSRPTRYKRRVTTASRPVFEIDGASFYTLATGENSAIHDLHAALASALESRFDRTLPIGLKNHVNEILASSLPRS